MRSCPQCGRTNVDTRVDCVTCGAALPVAGNQAQINFLLGEIPLWVARGWIEPGQADVLTGQYRERWQWLTFGSQQTQAVPQSPIALTPATAAVPSTSPRPEPATSGMAAFLEQASITYWHFIGGLLLLAGIGGLVAYTWNGIGRFLVFTLLIALTGGCLWLGRSARLRAFPIGQTVLLSVASLLAPLDVIMASRLGLFGPPLPLNPLGLCATAITLPLYGWLAARERSRSFTIFAAVDSAALLHFALQTFLPSADPWHRLGVYGLFYVPLAALYLVISKRAKTPELSTSWLWAAHAVVLTSLVLSFAAGPGTTSPIAAMWLAGALYAASAIAFDIAAFASFGALALSMALVLSLIQARIPIGHWYVYVLAAQVLAALYLVAELSLRKAERSRLADVWAVASTALSACGIVAQLVRAFTYLPQFPHFAFSTPDLLGALACAAGTIAIFRWTASTSSAGPGREFDLGYPYRAIADIVTGSIVVIVTALACTAGHVDFNVSTALLGAAAVVWLALRRDKIAAVFTLVAFGFSGVYAWEPAFYALTVTTFALETALLVAIAARREVHGDDGVNGLLVRLAIASSTCGVLLWQTHVLPWLDLHLGIDQNYGFGIALVAAVCALIAWIWRGSSTNARAALIGSAITLGTVDVIVQLAYAVVTDYSISPIVLIGAGILIAGGLAVVRGSDAAANWVRGLTICAYVAYLLDLAHFHNGMASAVATEITMSIVLLIGALMMSATVWVLRRVDMVYGTIIALLLGYGHCVHTLAEPDLPTMALYFLPIAVALFAVSIWRADALWQTPLRRAAFGISILSIAAVVWQGGQPMQITVLAAYGVLVGLVGALHEDTRYVAVASFAFAIDGWQLVHQLSTAGTPQSVLALRFDLLSLVWLPAAIVAGRTDRAAFARKTLFATAVISSIFAAAMSMGSGLDIYLVGTLIVTGCSLFTSSLALSEERLHHVGLWSFLLAYAVYLWQTLGPWSVDNADIFVFPAGVYVLYISVLERRRNKVTGQSLTIDWLGALMILTSSGIGAYAGAHAFLHSVAVASEAAGFVFAGIMMRRKAFAVTGTGFLIGLVCLQALGSATRIHWSIYATLLGALIIGSALYFEKRREEVLQLGRRIREHLNDWE